MGCYKLMDTPSKLKELEGGFTRRLRMILWKEWKNRRTGIEHLRK
ncbi:hypothetical protein [Bacillus pseudomycoides]